MVRGEQPRYIRLAATLRAAIEDGTYRPGDHLPTVVALKQEHGVNVATVQEAMKILKREGLIESTQGRRSRVLKKRCIIGRSASYVTPGPDGKRLTWKQQLAELGMEGTQKLGRVGEVPAPDEVAEIFNLAPGDPIILRPRVMFADDEPVQLADSYYPIEIASGTPLAQQKLVKGGSLPILAAAGYVPVDCTEELTFPLAGERERELLAVEPEVRVVRMVRTVLTEGDRPVELHVMTLKADRHRLTYRLPVHG